MIEANKQISLFENEQGAAKSRLKRIVIPTDEDAALIFIVTKREDNMHNCYRTLWEVSVDEAKAICSDDRTKGQMHFLAWIRKSDANLDHYKFITDNGKYDDVLNDLQINPK